MGKQIHMTMKASNFLPIPVVMAITGGAAFCIALRTGSTGSDMLAGTLVGSGSFLMVAGILLGLILGSDLFRERYLSRLPWERRTTPPTEPGRYLARMAVDGETEEIDIDGNGIPNRFIYATETLEWASIGCLKGTSMLGLLVLNLLYVVCLTVGVLAFAYLGFGIGAGLGIPCLFGGGMGLHRLWLS